MNAIRYAAAVLERIDPIQKLTHVAFAASLAGANHTVIRTQAEHDISPNLYQIRGGWGSEKNDPLQLQPAHCPRAALNYEAEALAEDLMTFGAEEVIDRHNTDKGRMPAGRCESRSIYVNHDRHHP